MSNYITLYDVNVYDDYSKLDFSHVVSQDKEFLDRFAQWSYEKKLDYIQKGDTYLTRNIVSDIR
jgi:hypothetical protein